MTRPVAVLILLSSLILSLVGTAAATDLKSDTWTATDAVGRSLPGYDEAGPPRAGKTVGVFYFLWLGAHGTQGPFNISDILAADPDNPRWGPLGRPHHWGEPELGYYLSTDEYVIRKHAQMLSDAGVDVIIFDVTNGFTYSEQYHKLCQTYLAIRGEGGATPQIAFLLPFWTVNAHTAAKKLYADMYAPGLYSELWFNWGGKPLMLADPSVFNWELKGFFTFRTPQPSYFDGPTGPEQWGWLEVWPQHGFYDASGAMEEVAVGVAQNAVGDGLAPMSDLRGAKGRSWQEAAGAQAPGEEAVNQGYNFAEQWQRALELDPSFIFITGWNEWVAARTNEWTGASHFTDPEGGIFVDCYNQEYSRDIEPMRGGHGDNYYFQMAAGIRRFKGVREPEKAGPARSISIDGRFADWEEATPSFFDTPGDTALRHEQGWGEAGMYVNTTGRNDFVELKAARDSRYVYFYARTQSDITAPEQGGWMLLYIDADQDPSTGWEGYDYLVNLEPQSGTRTSLSASDGQGGWDLERNDISLRVSGRELELAVPRSALGLSDGSLSFDFHWADNIQNAGDITAFALEGDSAPNRRFNYRFQTD